MSIDATYWAWSQSITPSQKIVLLSLADIADECGYCYSTMTKLVGNTSQSETDIKKSLRNLEKAGLIAIAEDNGYRLKMEALS